MPTCAACGDYGWVCERHPDRPWSRSIPGGCQCGAGMPCQECNATDGKDDPPRRPPGWTPIKDVN